MAIKKEIDRRYYSHLSLNEGAYFFEKGDAVISKTAISDLFDKVADGTKVLERLYRRRENGLQHAGHALCSLLVFTYDADPTFVNYGQNPVPQELVERKVGYLLINGETLSGILISGRGTNFQQVRIANMNTNANAMRNKTFEAEDLESTMAMFNANKTSLSASHFQDAIGQALKNIGYLNPTDAFLTAKRRNLANNATYNLNQQRTSIQRVRRGTAQQFVDEIKRLRMSPNFTREVCLAVDFLSRQELLDAFDNIVAGRPFKQKNYTVQLIWLLNAFISTCKDADLHCKIYCCE